MPTIDLNAIRVAKPCSADWAAMSGDEQVRHCQQCNLNVYDLSALSADEARGLIEKHEGRLCVRFYRRRDGTMLTRDCPVGVRTVRRRQVGVAAGLAAVAGFAGGLLQGLRGRALPVAVVQSPPALIPEQQPLEQAPLAAAPELEPEVHAIMGRVACVEPPTAPEPPAHVDPAEEPLELIMGDMVAPEPPPSSAPEDSAPSAGR